jgi:hypothetical protein
MGWRRMHRGDPSEVHPAARTGKTDQRQAETRLTYQTYTICNQEPSEWREMFWPLRPFGAERPEAAASPAGWPPPQHGAAARLRRAAAPQNTTDLHSETLCIELVVGPRARYVQ